MYPSEDGPPGRTLWPPAPQSPRSDWLPLFACAQYSANPSIPILRRAMVPGHDAIGRLTRSVEIFFILLAAGLLVANVVRALSAGAFLHWWTLPVLAIAACTADLTSGLVHWTADT